jgi:hypothetical protein
MDVEVRWRCCVVHGREGTQTLDMVITRHPPLGIDDSICSVAMYEDLEYDGCDGHRAVLGILYVMVVSPNL